MPVTVKQDENLPGNYKISGILDFGDISFNYYVFEIAIAICYMMIECKTMDILEAPGHVLAGYNRIRPIPKKEFVILKVVFLKSLLAIILLTNYLIGLHCGKILPITCFGCIF